MFVWSGRRKISGVYGHLHQGRSTWDLAECTSSKVHAPVPRRPKTLMTSIMALWPFYQWGMDIFGPLPQAAEKLKFVIVAIDYFTKWIEAKPLAIITGKDLKKFVWDIIVCRFGLPYVIVTDNITQFVNDPFKGWCESLNIKQINMTVAHPQTNGLVEMANKSLIEGIKARNEASRVEDQGKLGPKWEGPYRVTKAYQNGSYKLQTMGGKEVPRTWHAINLRKCYI
ncbi:reverse transcriptase domain-containing protein [Tanacetum coccineum]